jgi:hypothetical protein
MRASACLLMALFGHGAMSELSPLCARKRTWTLALSQIDSPP